MNKPAAPAPAAAPPPPPVRLYVALGVLLVVAAVMSWLLSGLGGSIAMAQMVAVFALIVRCLVALLPIWLAIAGWGYAIRRFTLDTRNADGAVATRASGASDWTVQLGAGLAVHLLLAGYLSWVDLLTPATSWLLCAAGAAVLAWQIATWWRAPHDSATAPHAVSWAWLLLLIAAAPLGMMLVAAAIPPGMMWQVEAFAYDVTSYHLQLPREWIASGGWRGYPHNVYSYFPSLAETLYMHIGLLADSRAGGIGATTIFASQFMHVSVSILAAATVGRVAGRLTNRVIGIVAGVLMFTVPWVMILGSLAYNEMYMVALGATAVAIALDPARRHWKAAAATGLIVGAATLVKLTAGPQLAVPVGLLWLLRLYPARTATTSSDKANNNATTTTNANAATPWRRALLHAAAAGAVGFAVLVPYFARNAAAADGNPIFPFAAASLGQAHWRDFDVDRWEKGHRTSNPWRDRLTSLYVHGFANAGYGAVGGHERQREDVAGAQFEAENVAHFKHEGGFGLFWVCVIVAAGMMLSATPLRPAAAGLLIMLAIQLAFWFTLTHLQSRFLILTLLPAILLLAGGLAQVTRWAPRRTWLAPAIIAMLAASNVLGSVGLFSSQMRVPPVYVVAGLDNMPMGETVSAAARNTDWLVNQLPDASLTYVMADNSPLLFLRKPMVYQSAFDPALIGELFAAHDGDAAAITAALRDRGITHVRVQWAELARLSGTYGFDPNVTPEQMIRLIQEGGWRDVTPALVQRLDSENWRERYRQLAGAETVFQLPTQQR